VGDFGGPEGGPSVGCCLDGGSAEAENHVCSSSDSDYDEDEPRKFYVHIKPVQPREAGGSAEATVEQLKATVGTLILPPSIGVSPGGAAGSAGTVPGPTDPLSPFPCRAPSSDSRPVSTTPGGSARRGGPAGSVSAHAARPCPSAGHVAPLTPALSDADPKGTLAAGEAVPGGSRGCEGGPGDGGSATPQRVPSPRR